MAVTFDAALSTDRDRIRFFLTQTDSDSPIEDETLDALIDQQPSIDMAAMQAAKFLAGWYNKKQIEVTALDVKSKYLDRAQYYLDLAQKLKTGEESVSGIATTGFAVVEMTEPDLTNYRTN